jgi:hypothetical protein
MSVEFRKSSYSNSNAQECVEIGNTLDAVRDSKNPDGPVLRCDVASLIAGIKAGRF